MVCSHFVIERDSIDLCHNELLCKGGFWNEERVTLWSLNQLYFSGGLKEYWCISTSKQGLSRQPPCPLWHYVETILGWTVLHRLEYDNALTETGERILLFCSAVTCHARSSTAINWLLLAFIFLMKWSSSTAYKDMGSITCTLKEIFTQNICTHTTEFSRDEPTCIPLTIYTLSSKPFVLCCRYTPSYVFFANSVPFVL